MKHTLLLAAALGAGLVTSPQYNAFDKAFQESVLWTQTNSVSDPSIIVGPPVQWGFTQLEGTAITSRSLQDGKLILTFQRVDHPNIVYAIPGGGPSPIKHVWREVYACGTNGIVLERVEHAKVTPAQTVTTPEKIEWGVEAKE